MGMIQSSINRLFLTSLGAVAGMQKVVSPKAEEPKAEEPKQSEPVETSEATQENVSEMLKEKGVDVRNPYIRQQLERATADYNRGYSDPVQTLAKGYENKRSIKNSVENRLKAIEEAKNAEELALYSSSWAKQGRAIRAKRKTWAQEEKAGLEHGKE